MRYHHFLSLAPLPAPDIWSQRGHVIIREKDLENKSLNWPPFSFLIFSLFFYYQLLITISILFYKCPTTYFAIIRTLCPLMSPNSIIFGTSKWKKCIGDKAFEYYWQYTNLMIIFSMIRLNKHNFIFKISTYQLWVSFLWQFIWIKPNFFFIHNQHIPTLWLPFLWFIWTKPYFIFKISIYKLYEYLFYDDLCE